MTEGRVGSGVLQVRFDRSQIEQAGKQDLIPSAQSLAKDIAGVFAAVKLIDIAKSGIDELKQAQAVTAETNVLLRNQGAQAGVTAEQVDQLGQSMLDLAGFDDEAARSAANVLIRFQAFQGFDGLKRVEGDAADLAVTMASATGGTADLTGAANLLGKALQDPEKAARILKPAIGDLTDAQKASIASFQRQGDIAGAQNVILQAVEDRVKGAAQQYGETLPASVNKASESWKNAKAELVGGFAPALELGAGVAKGLSDAISTAPEPVRELAGGVVLLGGAAAALVRPASDLIRIYESWSNRARTANDATKDLAAAQRAENDVAGTSVTSHSRLTTALGAAGVLGVAVAAGTAIYALGDSMNSTVGSAEQLDQVIKESTADAFKYLDSITQLATKGLLGIGVVDPAKVFQDLADKGAAGIGVLQQYSDHLHQTGQDASVVDAVLQRTKDTQAQLNVNVAAGNAVLPQEAGNMRILAGTTDLVAQSAKDLATAQQQQNQEHATRLASVTNLFDAEQSLTGAEHSLEQANRGVADANRGVADAERRVEDAQRSRTDAVQRLTEAETALQKAQKPADAETLGKADLAVSDARFRVADANSAVTKAERAAADARRDGKHSAAEVADLDRQVLEAKNSVQSATYAETDAEKALQDVQAKGTDQDQAVIDARKAVEDATKQVDTANRNVADSYQGVSDAQQRVVDAKDAVDTALLGTATATANLKDKQDALFTGTQSATGELYNQGTALDAIRDKLDPTSPLRKNLDSYLGDLAFLRDIFTMDATGGDIERNIHTGGAIVRDVGGRVEPGQLFRNAGTKPEILWPGLHVSPIGGYVSSSTDLEKWSNTSSGGLHMNGDTYIVNPEPEPASTSISRELAIMADKLALVG